MVEPTDDESQQLDEQMEQLYGALLRLDDEEDNEQLMDWVKNVCDPNYGVVDGLVCNFIDFVDDKPYVTKILKILKKVNEHIPQISLPQLCSNIYFPGALVKYLESTELKDLAGDAFILLVNLFDDKTVKVASPEFVQKIIDSIPFIVDENTVYALISILVCVLPYFEKTQPHDNLILNEFIKQEREDFYKDKLLYLTNRGSMYRLDKCMHSIGCLLTNHNSEHFFNQNDLDLLVDIGLRELASPNASKARVHTLKVLNLILEHPTYLDDPQSKQKLNDFNKCLEEQIMQEDQQHAYAQKERQEMAKMNIKLMALCAN